MDGGGDFIQRLEHDMAAKILGCLDDPYDLVRVSTVSSSWRQFVITAGLFKQLCRRMFPETSNFTHVVENRNMFDFDIIETDDCDEWAYMESEHRAYASLSQCLTSFTGTNCIQDAICASSTDNYPEESVKNTLEPSDKVDRRASYWSSKGQTNPAACETLVYELAAKLCLITEVHVHPFQAYFQYGFPIYSSKAVRFQTGHPKVPLQLEDDDDGEQFLSLQEFSDDMFVWTYTSPEFPMAQENRLQKFILPEPVLAIGGILKVELLGRVQTQEMDGRYYICITNVQVLGRPLLPAFDVQMLDAHGKCSLKYHPMYVEHLLPVKSLDSQPSSSSRFHRFSASLRSWEQRIFNSLRRAGPLIVNDDDSDYEYLD